MSYQMSNFDPGWKPEVVKVQYVVSGSEDVYTMENLSRGPCLIINNMEFPNYPTEGNRQESYHDAERLKHVFENFRFNVSVKENLTAQEMFREIQSHAQEGKAKESWEAFVLVLLSHGGNGYILGTDGERLYYSQIIELLSNVKCPHLKGKPKMCFVQACQGGKPSFAVDDLGNPLPVNTGTSFPEVSDFLLSFAAQKGFQTTKCDGIGIYATHLADVLASNAHNTHLLDMLTLLEKKVRNTYCEVKHEESKEVRRLCQSTSVTLLGWEKKLFFNPADEDAKKDELPLPPSSLNLQSDITNIADNLDLESINLPGTSSKTRNYSVWVIGGSKPPEVLYGGATEWKEEQTCLSVYHQAVPNSPNGNVYVFDQYDLYEWKVQTEKFNKVVKMIDGHKLFAHAFVYDSVYFIGGKTGKKYYGCCRSYNTKNGISKYHDLRKNGTQKGQKEEKVVGKQAVVFNGKIYFSLGTEKQLSRKLCCFDTNENILKEVSGGFSTPRNDYAIAACERFIWIFGGKNDERYLADVERYCPGSDDWSPVKGSMKTARANLSVSYNEGKFYAIGGETAEGVPVDVVEVYDVANDCWEAGPSLRCPRSGHSSFVHRMKETKSRKTKFEGDISPCQKRNKFNH